MISETYRIVTRSRKCDAAAEPTGATSRFANAAQAALQGKSTSRFKKAVLRAKAAAKAARKAAYAKTDEIEKNIKTSNKIVMERKAKMRHVARQEKSALKDQKKAEAELAGEKGVKGKARLRAIAERGQKGKALVRQFQWREHKREAQEQKFNRLLARRRYNMKKLTPYKESKRAQRRLKRRLRRLKRRATRKIKRKIKFQNWILSAKMKSKEKKLKYKLSKEGVVDATGRAVKRAARRHSGRNGVAAKSEPPDPTPRSN